MASSPAQVTSELRFAMRECRSALIGAGVASGLVNILALTSSIFMLQVYDRVLPSRSVPTLIGLSLLALVMFGFQALLDWLRSRILTRTGRLLEEKVGRRIFDAVMRRAVKNGSTSDGSQPLRDLDTVRSFLSSVGLTAFFDLPWMPLYVGICFLFHPWMGLLVLAGAVVLGLFAMLTEVSTRRAAQDIVVRAAARNLVADTARRNAVLVHGMGMRADMAARWTGASVAYLDRNQAMTDVASGLGSLSRMLRTVLQSAVLALGAYLVVDHSATAGVMLAATILTARALAPVEMVIANWRGFLAARQGWGRLSALMSAFPPEQDHIALDPPCRHLRLTGVSLAPPGSTTPVLHNVTFTLNAGNVLGVIGPTGSGKSSLARALVNAWVPATGVIRLDGATPDSWDPDTLGRSIGYLPQDIELFPGTIAENISRFSTEPNPKGVLAAAAAADVHEIILRLPNGYETQVGEGGMSLSGGQRQRIALARAMYGDPFLMVLDEPNSNLDAEGERALLRAIGVVKARGGIVIVIAHRHNVMLAVDTVLILNAGQVQAFGPRETIFPRLAVAEPGKSPPGEASGPAVNAPSQRPRHAIANQ